MASEQEVSDILAALVDYYDNGDKFSAAKTRLYIQALVDLDADVLEAAAAEHVREGKWFPKVAELREIAQRLHPTTSRDEDDAADERRKIYAHAWEMGRLWMRHEITDEQYDSDRAVAYCKRQVITGPVDDAAAWALACQQTEAWMVADYGPDWRKVGASLMQGAEV